MDSLRGGSDLSIAILSTAILEAKLEPISKSLEQDSEASELDEAEEVLMIILPADENASLPLNPGEEALYQPSPRISAEPASILCRRLAAV